MDVCTLSWMVDEAVSFLTEIECLSTNFFGYETYRWNVKLTVLSRGRNCKWCIPLPSETQLSIVMMFHLTIIYWKRWPLVMILVRKSGSFQALESMRWFNYVFVGYLPLKFTEPSSKITNYLLYSWSTIFRCTVSTSCRIFSIYLSMSMWELMDVQNKGLSSIDISTFWKSANHSWVITKAAFS